MKLKSLLKFLIFAFVCAGCSRSLNEATLKIRIDDTGAGRTQSNALASFGKYPDLTSYAQWEVSDFSCLGVNVVGEGIGSQDTSNSPAVLAALLSNTSRCSYPGITSPPLGNGSIVDTSVTVPLGNQRLVQVAGIVDPSGTFCTSSSPNFNTSGLEFYEVGRTILNVTGNANVEIANSYDPLNYSSLAGQKMNCGEGTGAFSPSSVSNLLAWYKADSIAACASGGTPITSWANSAPNTSSDATYNLNTDTYGTRTCYPTIANGSAAVQIAAGGFVSGALSSSPNVSVSAMFVVARPTSLSGTNYLTSLGQAGVDNVAINFSGTSTFVGTMVGVSATATTTFDTSSFKVYSATGVSAISGTLELRINGELVGVNSGTFTNPAMVGIRVGRDGPTGNYLVGYIAEVLIYSAALSTSQRKMVECYLSSKYSLGVSGC